MDQDGKIHCIKIKKQRDFDTRSPKVETRILKIGKDMPTSEKSQNFSSDAMKSQKENTHFTETKIIQCKLTILTDVINFTKCYSRDVMLNLFMYLVYLVFQNHALEFNKKLVIL